MIDVTVGKAKPEEMPSVVQLYKKRGVETSGVGPANTHVARTESGRVVGALSVVNCGVCRLSKILRLIWSWRGGVWEGNFLSMLLRN